MRAKVDLYLDWHHTNIRLGAGTFFFRRFWSHLIRTMPPQHFINEGEKIFEKSLKQLERVFLSEKHPFLFGEKPTIADIALFSELI